MALHRIGVGVVVHVHELLADEVELGAQLAYLSTDLAQPGLGSAGSHVGSVGTSAKLAGVYDEWGIAEGYFDVDGEWHPTDPLTIGLLRDVIGDHTVIDSPPLWFVAEHDAPMLWGPCRVILEDGRELGPVDHLPTDLPCGYHTLRPEHGGPDTALVVHPARCPDAPDGWGLAAQVASLWRRDGWGIGDLADVAELGASVAGHGGSVLLLSPLHSPAPTFPQEDSPYYPSSRRWLNPMLVPIHDESPPSVNNAPGGLIERDSVWRAKRNWMAARFETAKQDAVWRSWARAQGSDLWRFCAWNALADEYGPRWRDWPESMRSPERNEVVDRTMTDRDFADRCDFHAYCQWLVAAEVAHASAAAGIGLIGDLAVGSSPDGADAWMHQGLMALNVRIGAPPDTFNADGQEWGLPPFIPSKARAAHFRPFIAMVRAAFSGMAGLRIDHVMGLFRQWWVPAGLPPTKGAYVRQPSEELLAIIRLEAQRAGAFVVGEDLGTVEDGVREAMRDSNILGTTVWWFDPEAAEWPQATLATVTTHDLPCVAGVIAGTDGTDEMRDALDELPGRSQVVAVHESLGASPARLRLASLDDLAGATERPNQPGTLAHQHPNWRRRMPGSVAQLLDGEPGASIIAAMSNGGRPTPR